MRRSRGLPALGPRGEGWVLLQGILLGGLMACALLGARWPTALRPWFWATAAVLAAAGGTLFVGGVRRLGDQITPFPKPVEGGELRQEGVYGLVRHPIYGGVLLLSLAVCLATSPLACLPAALLVVLFVAKSRREEAWIIERKPGYEAYRQRVRKRFIPAIW